MTTKDAIKHLSYKIAYYKGIEQKKWADSVSIDALEIAVRAMAEERKKAKWIKRGRMVQCPECGRFTTIQENYCPSCGLDMREEKQDAEIH